MDPLLLHHKAITLYLTNKFGPKVDAENLASELVMEEWASQTVKSIKEIYHRGIDETRKTKHETTLDSSHEESKGCLPPEECTLPSLAILTLEERVIVHQRFWESLTLRDIAEQRGEHPTTTRKRWLIIVNKLRGGVR